MKKTFLNLRKMGFVLVAASGMLAFSCGGEEAADDATDAIENLGDQLNDMVDDAVENADDAVDNACDAYCDTYDLPHDSKTLFPVDDRRAAIEKLYAEEMPNVKKGMYKAESSCS